MSLPCLEVRRSARARAAVTMRILLVPAVSLLVTTGASSAADSDVISGMHDKTPIGEFGARSSRTREAAWLC